MKIDLQKLDAGILEAFFEKFEDTDNQNFSREELLEIAVFVLLITQEPRSYGGLGAKEILLTYLHKFTEDKFEGVIENLFCDPSLDGSAVAVIEREGEDGILALPESLIKIATHRGERALQRMLA